MAKAFIVADVHAFYDELMEALESKGFDKDNPDHIFVSLGDLLDRGPKPLECLQFVNSLPDNRKILVRGNHEDLMEEALGRGGFYSHDVSNGTCDTVLTVTGHAYTDLVTKEASIKICKEFQDNAEWKKYINSCVDYWEDEHNVFVHGWIPAKFKGFSKYYPQFSDNWRTSDWSEARWLNGMEMWNNGIKIPDKTIWCGHWHTSWGHAYLHKEGCEWDSDDVILDEVLFGVSRRKAIFKPFEDEGICAMDACTAYSEQLNCKTVRIKKLK